MLSSYYKLRNSFASLFHLKELLFPDAEKLLHSCCRAEIKSPTKEEKKEEEEDEVRGREKKEKNK